MHTFGASVLITVRCTRFNYVSCVLLCLCGACSALWHCFVLSYTELIDAHGRAYFTFAMPTDLPNVNAQLKFDAIGTLE